MLPAREADRLSRIDWCAVAGSFDCGEEYEVGLAVVVVFDSD